jgi:predicted  nucleic acid-binding Zn-ribbon protein
MSLDNLSRSEILEKAHAIRTSLPQDGPTLIDPHDSEILAQADLICRERKSSGIAAIFESLTSAIRGERAAAQAALDRANHREAAIEKLLTEQAGLEKAVQLETTALQRIEGLTIEYRAKTSTANEAAAMLERFYARHDPRFVEHLQMAVAGITTNRLILEALPAYAKQSRAEIAALESELQAVQKQISKLK